VFGRIGSKFVLAASKSRRCRISHWRIPTVDAESSALPWVSGSSNECDGLRQQVHTYNVGDLKNGQYCSETATVRREQFCSDSRSSRAPQFES